MAAEKAQTQTATGIGCGLVLLAGLAIWGWTALVGGASAKYSATISDYTVISPSQLAVTLHIANTGGASGTPTCTVQVHDASYAHSGVDAGDLAAPIAKGETTTTVMTLKITGEGASFITDGTVNCS